MVILESYLYHKDGSTIILNTSKDYLKGKIKLEMMIYSDVNPNVEKIAKEVRDIDLSSLSLRKNKKDDKK